MPRSGIGLNELLAFVATIFLLWEQKDRPLLAASSRRLHLGRRTDPSLTYIPGLTGNSASVTDSFDCNHAIGCLSATELCEIYHVKGWFERLRVQMTAIADDVPFHSPYCGGWAAGQCVNKTGSAFHLSAFFQSRSRIHAQDRFCLERPFS